MGRRRGARAGPVPAVHGRRRIDRLSIACLLTCAGMGLLSSTVVLRGIRQNAALDGNAYGVAAGMGPGHQLRRETASFSIESETAVVADGLFLARSAALMPEGPARTAQLRLVIAMVEPQRARKAFWGEASTTLAYAYGLLDADGSRLVPMLEQSYRQSPYLRSSAYWRIGAGLANWDRLDAGTRGRLIEEAVWFTRINDGSIGTILPMFRETPAYEQFLIARLKARIGDRDFSPIEALTKQKAGH